MKESIKSALIVVLTLTTTLLLFVFWEEIPLKNLSLSDLEFSFYEEEDIVPTDMYEVLQPSYVLISTGEGEYIVDTDTVKTYGKPSTKGSFLELAVEALKEENVFAEEITAEQYETAYSYKSYRAVFDYYLSLTDYWQKLGIDKAEWMDNVNDLAEFGFSEAAPDSLLFKGKSGDKFYRIVASSNLENLKSFFESLEVADAAYYYPISAYMGEEADNETLLPVYLETDMPEGTGEYAAGTAMAEQQAKSYFGNTFDFVRKIQESGGKVIYMYGYGETVLILNTDGSVEYKTEESGTENADYCTALAAALRFADSHPDMTTSGGTELKLKLASVENKGSGHGTYRFGFDIYAGGYRIYGADEHPVVIEVSGGVVTYYYSRLPQVTIGSAGYVRGAYPAINVLAMHLPDRVQYVKKMNYGYLCTEGELRPVWQVELAGLKEPLYFDLFTADIYGLD